MRTLYHSEGVLCRIRRKNNANAVWLWRLIVAYK